MLSFVQYILLVPGLDDGVYMYYVFESEMEGVHITWYMYVYLFNLKWGLLIYFYPDWSPTKHTPVPHPLLRNPHVTSKGCGGMFLFLILHVQNKK